MEETKEISKTESLASEVLNSYFFIEPDTRLLKNATDVFPGGMTFVRLNNEEVQKIKNKSETSTPKTYIEFIRVPTGTNLNDLYKGVHERELLLNYHEIIAFCEKYREWFKNHICIAYFFTKEGFVLVKDDYCTGELSFRFFKMVELERYGLIFGSIKPSLNFIIKIDWGKFVPH